MPYRNIMFVKLEKRLLDDERFFMMSEISQLIFLKCLLIAAKTYNKCPKNQTALKLLLKTNIKRKTLESSLEEIKRNFPKFKENNNFYYFEDFHEHTNWIDLGVPREFPGSSQGVPREVTDKDKEKDKEKETTEGPSAALKALLDQVYKKGLNIYALLNQLRNKRQWPKDKAFPEDVLIRVCEAYLKDPEKINKSPWAWFTKALTIECDLWQANQSVEEHKLAKSAPVFLSIEMLLNRKKEA